MQILLQAFLFATFVSAVVAIGHLTACIVAKQVLGLFLECLCGRHTRFSQPCFNNFMCPSIPGHGCALFKRIERSRAQVRMSVKPCFSCISFRIRPSQSLLRSISLRQQTRRPAFAMTRVQIGFGQQLKRVWRPSPPTVGGRIVIGDVSASVGAAKPREALS